MHFDLRNFVFRLYVVFHFNDQMDYKKWEDDIGIAIPLYSLYIDAGFLVVS